MKQHICLVFLTLAIAGCAHDPQRMENSDLETVVQIYRSYCNLSRMAKFRLGADVPEKSTSAADLRAAAFGRINEYLENDKPFVLAVVLYDNQEAIHDEAKRYLIQVTRDSYKIVRTGYDSSDYYDDLITVTPGSSRNTAWVYIYDRGWSLNRRTLVLEGGLEPLT